MIFTKSELHRRGDDVTRKGWTTRFYHDFLDSVWREPFINRTSGFNEAGGPDSVIAFDNLTRIFSISPVTNKFAFWQFIVRITFFKRYEPMELEIPNEEGLYLIYLFREEEDKTHKRQKLFYTKNPTLEDIREVYLNRVIVGWIYWTYDLQEAIYFGDSRHGSEWPPQVHWSWHQTLNSLRESGIQIVNATYDGDGTQDAHFQFGITAGTLWHEDIHTSVDAVSDGEALPVWYFNEAGDPRFSVSPGKKFLNAGRVAFNSATGGLIQATNNWFVVYHLFATNCKLQPVISAMGQSEFETLGAATGTIEAEVATLRQTLPHSNLMHIGSFILQTNDGYTNDAKARVVWISSKEDTFTIGLEFDENNRILSLVQNNNKPVLNVEIPGINTIGAKTVTQASHGLSVKNVIRHNGTSWVKAQANNAENAQTAGIVVEVVDVNTFKYQGDGFFDHLDFVEGIEYFLSPSTAGLITTEPATWNIGEVRQSLGWGTPQGLKIEIDVGDEIGEIEYAQNTEVQQLSGTSAYWNVELGLSARITISGNTTITMAGLVAGQSGNLTVTNPATEYDIIFSGYTFKISQVVRKATNKVYLSGSSVIDTFSWYYDGNVVIINGQLNYL